MQNLAANGSFYDIPGPVVAAVPFYGNVIVFKQNSVWLMSPAGPPNSWATQLISDMTGTWNQECVIPLADQVIFIGSDDFYTTSGPVLTRTLTRCAERFFNNVNQTFIGSTYGFYDESNGTAYWHFVSKAALHRQSQIFSSPYNLRSTALGHWTPQCNGWCRTRQLIARLGRTPISISTACRSSWRGPGDRCF